MIFPIPKLGNTEVKHDWDGGGKKGLKPSKNRRVYGN